MGHTYSVACVRRAILQEANQIFGEDSKDIRFNPTLHESTFGVGSDFARNKRRHIKMVEELKQSNPINENLQNADLVDGRNFLDD